MLSYITLVGTFLAYTASGSSSSYTYCYNYTQCENETISTKYASCYGYYGCDGSDITSTYTLAYGELGAYDAAIDSKYTYAYGHYGAYGADVETYHMYTYGYQSARIADIEPYSNALNIYFYGYYAGYGADVSCYSGDTCNIYCGSGYGCYGVDFYCYSGATCTYDCSGDDTCPTTYSGVSSDLTYVTSVGAATSGESSSVVVFEGLSDDEISDYKLGNRIAKDSSKAKLEQDTKDDTQRQLHMTMEQRFWEEGEDIVKDENDKYAERHLAYPESKLSKKYKLNKKSGGNMVGSGNEFFLGISLVEYGTALVVDIFVVAIAVQAYNYCMRAKAYQQL